MLEVSNYFCTNPRCKDYGIKGKGNLNVHFRYGKHNRRILYCTTCKIRFSETKGTAFFGSKYSAETIGKIFQATTEGVARLMVNFLAGDRTEESGRAFLTELARRLGDIKPLFTSELVRKAV